MTTQQIKNETRALERMRLPELRARYTEVLGESTRCPNKKYLVRRIIEALQAAAEVDAGAEDPAPARETSGGGIEEAPAAAREGKSTVAELQARYSEVVGRPTGSDNVNYLRWKIRQAEKGRVRVGPAQPRRNPDAKFMVLPLRMEADLVERLDEVWRRQNLRSRMDLFRQSLRTYLARVGEQDVAELLAPRANVGRQGGD